MRGPRSTAVQPAERACDSSASAQPPSGPQASQIASGHSDGCWFWWLRISTSGSRSERRVVAHSSNGAAPPAALAALACSSTAGRVQGSAISGNHRRSHCSAASAAMLRQRSGRSWPCTAVRSHSSGSSWSTPSSTAIRTTTSKSRLTTAAASTNRGRGGGWCCRGSASGCSSRARSAASSWAAQRRPAPSTTVNPSPGP